MDPNDTLRLLLLAIDADNPAAADEHSANLIAWLRRGGFAPVMRRGLPSYPRYPHVERRHVYINSTRTAAIMTVDPNSTDRGFMLCAYNEQGDEERFLFARPVTSPVSGD
jgi:hypothetical protein